MGRLAATDCKKGKLKVGFISYAQNFEDVMLWRVLKHVEQGFYIDVGANDPHVDSVTKVFYERGWSGINIEPLPKHYADLLKHRPRDINLQCAIGEASGELELWECDVRGWATAADEVVEMHERAGHKGEYHRVPVRTLAEVCSMYAPEDVHFLKIDVEGLEKAVIAGADLNQYRPWVLVIEATRPNSIEVAYHDWEELVLQSNYHFVYFDGLNRFYVAREHMELAEAFNCPPNVFDGFKLAAHQFAEDSLIQAEKSYVELEGQFTSATNQAEEAEARATRAEAYVVEMEACVAEAEAQVRETEARLARMKIYAADAVARAIQVETHAAEVLEIMRQKEKQSEQYEAKLRHAEAEADKLLAQLHSIYASKSWRITAPLRMTMQLAKRLLRCQRGSPHKENRRKLSFRGILGQGLGRAVAYIKRIPRLKRMVLGILSRMPGLNIRLRRLQAQAIYSQVEKGDSICNDHAQKQIILNLGSEGVNAHQRSPLEAHFRAYGTHK